MLICRLHSFSQQTEEMWQFSELKHSFLHCNRDWPFAERMACVSCGWPTFFTAETGSEKNCPLLLQPICPVIKMAFRQCNSACIPLSSKTVLLQCCLLSPFLSISTSHCTISTALGRNFILGGKSGVLAVSQSHPKWLFTVLLLITLLFWIISKKRMA